MTLEELKDQNVSAVERAKAVVSALGLKGDERSVVVGLSKGDKFKLVAMNKVDLPANADRPNQSNFTPITFSTDTGATIGAKHFAGVEIDDDAPAIGSTPLENAAFLVYCIDHNVTFKVDKKVTEHIEAEGTRPAYNKNTYKVVVEDYD
jgi:hypothetical protein